jgi:acetyl-CoA acetyltransferase
MNSAVIVDAVRTPTGKNGGKLKDWHPASLGAHVLQALAARNPIDVETIDDVIFGCVMQVGPQTLNVARNAVLTAGWPETIPATTVDRQCGSSQQAIHFAAQGVMAGAYDAVVAGGVEAMTQVPLGASIIKDMAFPYTPAMLERYAETGLPHQGIGAEMIADEWGLSRADLEPFGSKPKTARNRCGSTRASAPGRPQKSSRTSNPRSKRTASTPRGIRRRSPTAHPPY